MAITGEDGIHPSLGSGLNGSSPASDTFFEGRMGSTRPEDDGAEANAAFWLVLLTKPSRGEREPLVLLEPLPAAESPPPTRTKPAFLQVRFDSFTPYNRALLISLHHGHHKVRTGLDWLPRWHL